MLLSDMTRAEGKLAQADSEIQELRRQIMVAEYTMSEQSNKEFADLLLESYYKDFAAYTELTQD